jgi:hypothetical protein
MIGAVLEDWLKPNHNRGIFTRVRKKAQKVRSRLGLARAAASLPGEGRARRALPGRAAAAGPGRAESASGARGLRGREAEARGLLWPVAHGVGGMKPQPARGLG